MLTASIEMKFKKKHTKETVKSVSYLDLYLEIEC